VSTPTANIQPSIERFEEGEGSQRFEKLAEPILRTPSAQNFRGKPINIQGTP
jgi:hypothetical protein